jgi:hypothetical protein
VTNTTTFAGGITNSGTISAGHFNDGIFVLNTSIFSGDFATPQAAGLQQVPVASRSSWSRPSRVVSAMPARFR